MTSAEIYRLITENNFPISTDTRTVEPGDFFVAIHVEQFDGKQYAAEALIKGAAYALIDNPEFNRGEKYILVENTLKTLQEVATLHRQQFTIPVLAIGGSNGKTTTKELISAVLQTTHKTHTTTGNLNNDIGVPLTILRMKKESEIAVIEIGANHPGEHTLLMNIVQPTHVLVTNNGADHLEGFGTLAGVRAANKEIYDIAKKLDAHAFVYKNLHDLVEDSTELPRTLYPKENIQSISETFAGISHKGISFTSQLFGSFNEPNILAAIAVGEYFTVPLTKIAHAIQEYTPTLKRSQVIKKDDYKIILDCYNANPSSMELSLGDFFKTSEAGKRVLIIGDMFELGNAEEESHKTLLDFLTSHADTEDIVLCIGPRLAKQKTSESFLFFPDALSAKNYFDSLPLSDKKVFIKGSRGMKLETIL